VTDIADMVKMIEGLVSITEWRHSELLSKEVGISSLCWERIVTLRFGGKPSACSPMIRIDDFMESEPAKLKRG
jgi:hypothetical protein